jgi:hypothetical protein
MNLNEYVERKIYDAIDYRVMKTIATLAYQVIIQGIDKPIDSIDMYVSTNDELKSWEYEESDEYPYTIFFRWIPLDKIDHYYTLYKARCRGLKESSLLDLAAAEDIEEQYTSDDDKRAGPYSVLAKLYCGVIEQELNEIIKLHNLPDCPKNHLMWNDIKKYVKKNHIELDDCFFSLEKLLDDLHAIRNLSSHGEVVTEEQYVAIRYYKVHNLFNILSNTKINFLEPDLQYHPHLGFPCNH